MRNNLEFKLITRSINSMIEDQLSHEVESLALNAVVSVRVDPHVIEIMSRDSFDFNNFSYT